MSNRYEDSIRLRGASVGARTIYGSSDIDKIYTSIENVYQSPALTSDPIKYTFIYNGSIKDPVILTEIIKAEAEDAYDIVIDNFLCNSGSFSMDSTVHQPISNDILVFNKILI